MSVEKIREVLALLEDSDKHFTSDDLPRVDIVEGLAGINTSRDEITAAAPEFTRKNLVIPTTPTGSGNQAPTVEGKSEELGDSEKQKSEAQVELTESRSELEAAKKRHLKAVEAMDVLLAKENKDVKKQKLASTVSDFQASQAEARKNKAISAKEIAELIVKQQAK